MESVIQRVTKASWRVEGEITGQIERGFVVLIGVEDSDNIRIADKMIQKLLNMRIFADEQGKTNLALADVKGGLLLISQFTLCANCKKGNRPSFTGAGKPEFAEEMYEYIIRQCRECVEVVQTGVFGADMEIALVNDGPFTIILDSRELSI